MPADAEGRGVAATYAIKAEVHDPQADAWVFDAQKTMYGGKRIAAGDAVFVFASENEGGRGLVYRQATNKIVGISEKAAAFLRGYF